MPETKNKPSAEGQKTAEKDAKHAAERQAAKRAQEQAEKEREDRREAQQRDDALRHDQRRAWKDEKRLKEFIQACYPDQPWHDGESAVDIAIRLLGRQPDPKE